MSKRVAVVGAGACGLPSIRHALLDGFEVVCYEAQEDIGGLWRYRDDGSDGACVMRSTVMNTSKDMTAYSDFPPCPEEANFMHNTRMQDYIRDYARHFGLEEHIKLRHKVLNVVRADDYLETGRWNLTVQDLRYTYGIGNSACDVAVELSRAAKQAYMVTRRGAWVGSRLGPYGQPLDCIRNSRFYSLMARVLPKSVMLSKMTALLNHRFDHHVFGLKPDFSVFSAHLTTNEELPNRISSGTLKIKPQIDHFDGNSVHFVDGTSIEHVDTVILGTGYSISFPLVEDGQLIKVVENEVELYLHMFPLDLAHDTISAIGLIQPLGSIMPVAEIQARLALQAIAGTARLPSKEERRAAVVEKRERMSARFVKSPRHTIQAEYLPYFDELAELIGCTPPTWTSLLFTDPVLAAHSLLGPQAAYFYRLRGPHPWPHARQAILGIPDRQVKATNPTMQGRLFTTRNMNFAILLQFLQLLFCAFIALVVFVVFVIYRT